MREGNELEKGLQIVVLRHSWRGLSGITNSNQNVLITAYH